MKDNERPVAFFDSGLGGLSVLKAARIILPHENFIYFGDSANAPYGTKGAEEIITLSDRVVQKVLAMGAKAVVVACNTATGEAINTLREHYPDTIFIGTEPAIKPAAFVFPGGRILVMATPQCLESDRVKRLMATYGAAAHIVPVPCPGLMEFVERGELGGAALKSHLQNLLAPYIEDGCQAVVMGCTHYPFVKDAVAELLPGAAIIDGNAGIAAQLKRRLEEEGLLNVSDSVGTVDIINSSDDPAFIERSVMLLDS